MGPTGTVLLSVEAQGHPRLTAQAALVEQKIALAATAAAKAQVAAAAVVTIKAYLQTVSPAQAALQVSNRLAALQPSTALPSRLLLAQGAQGRTTVAEAAATAQVAASVCRGTATPQFSQVQQHR